MPCLTVATHLTHLTLGLRGTRSVFICGFVMALLLALGRPARADIITVDTSMVSPGSYNQLSAHLNYSGSPGGGSDTQNTDLSGSQQIKLDVTFNTNDYTATVNGFAFVEAAPGNVNLSDLHWHWTFTYALLTFNIYVNSSGVSGSGRTVPTFSSVSGGSFPTGDHHFMLNNGSVQPSTDAPGQSLSGINLASSPLDAQTLGQQGQVTMTLEGGWRYAVTWTMPVNFTQNLDGNTTLNGSGTLQATGYYQISSPTGADEVWVGNANGWDSSSCWIPNGTPGSGATVAHLNGSVMFLQADRSIGTYGLGGGVVGQIVGASDWSSTHSLHLSGNFYMKTGTLGPNLILAHDGVAGHLCIGNGGNVLLNCDNQYNTTDPYGTEIGWSDGAAMACTVKLADWRALNPPGTLTHVYNGSTLDLNGVSGVRGGGIVMDGGTSLLNNSGTAASTTAPVTVNGATLGGPGGLTLSAGVFGQDFTKTGTGTLIIGADSGCAGSIAIAVGTLQVGNGGGGGSLGSASVVNNGTLVFNRAGACVVPGSLSGPGPVNFLGPGTVILTGANSFGAMNYGGISSISAGTVQVGNGGTSGTLGNGPVAVSSALVFNRADTLLVPNLLGGPGTLSQNGPGTLILTGDNVYSGGTTVSAGTLQVGAGGTSGLLGSGPVLNNAALVFNRADDLAFGGAISGGGTVVQNGPGTLVLTGGNSYTGPTTVNGGTLVVGGTHSAGSGTYTVTSGATLRVDGAVSTSRDLSIDGTLGGSGELDAYTTVFGTLAPHNAGGSLVVSDTLALLGTTVMEVNHDGAVAASDCVIAATLYGFSSLVVTNTGVNALRAGDQFHLFYWMSASSDFYPVTLPPLPSGLVWSNHLATDGALSVIGQPVPLTPRFGAPVLSGSTLTLAGTGGEAGGTYYVLSSTNLAAPRGTWTAVATNKFDSKGALLFTPTVDPAQPQQFYLIAIP